MTLVDISTGEVVEVVRDARGVLAALDLALDTFYENGIALALAITDAQATRCWDYCEDFQHQLEAKQVKLVQRRREADRSDTTDWLATYCTWRGRALGAAVASRLAAAGKTYRLLEVGMGGTPNGRPTLLPENERQLRPLTKALAAGVADDEIAAALAESWKVALRRNENKPSKAAAAFPSIARESDYEPLADRYKAPSKKLVKARNAVRFDGDVLRCEAEFQRLYELNPAAGRQLLARLTEYVEREEAHRNG